MTGWRFCRGVPLIWCLIVVLSGALLGGCSQASSPAELYLQRLAGALDQSVPAAGRELLATFPTGNELRLPRLAPKLGLTDVPAVQRCELGPLVGARNGALGRVQQPSQRFLYDVALLKQLRSCTEPGPTLSQLQAERTAELGVSLFNALFAGEEWHALATPPIVHRPQPVDQLGLQRIIGALRSIVREPLAADVANLEEHLARLRTAQALGRQRLAWQTQSEVLERATRMLQLARVENPGCRNGKPTENGRIRKRVFERYYVAGLQPELADQGQADRGWLKALGELVVAATQVVPDAAAAERVARWHQSVLGDQPQHEFGRWQAAIAAHTQAWQWQLRACALMPKAGSSQ